MVKYTTNTLNKLEEVFKEAGYIVRFEKGSFNAGYCIVEHKKVIVINKYYTLEARVGCLLDILAKVEIPLDNLSDASKVFIEKLPKPKLPI